MEKIAQRIKNRRIELKMSQDELAEKVGYKSRSSINKLEKDARNLPQNKILSLAEALDVSPSYLMGWEKNSLDDEIRILMKKIRLGAKLDIDYQFTLPQFYITKNEILDFENEKGSINLAFLNRYCKNFNINLTKVIDVAELSHIAGNDDSETMRTFRNNHPKDLEPNANSTYDWYFNYYEDDKDENTKIRKIIKIAKALDEEQLEEVLKYVEYIFKRK